MDIAILDIGASNVASVAVVLAIVELIKRQLGTEGRWTFGVSVLVGIVLAFASRFMEVEQSAELTSSDVLPITTALYGLMLGLSASGLYTGSKAIAEPSE